MKKVIIGLVYSLVFSGCMQDNSMYDIKRADFQTVNICNQNWMTKNLDVVTYRNGDTIPNVTDPTEWSQLTTGAWCYYENDSSLGKIYGKLYNWYAVVDPRGLAPEGYRVSSNADWFNLYNCLGDSAGNKMREVGTAHWEIPDEGATNSSGFTGLGGGACDNNQNFVILKIWGCWWTTDQADYDTDAWQWGLLYDVKELNGWNCVKKNGVSVRCIKND